MGISNALCRPTMHTVADSDRRAFLAQLATAAALTIAGMPSFAQPRRTESQSIPRNSTMPRSLQQISDRMEIEDLLVRYCYAVDDRDWTAYRNVFTPDAVIDDTVTGGVRSGVEEHVTYMTRALAKILISQHAISTLLIDLEDNEAAVRLHCSCPMVVDLGGGKTQVFFQGLWYRNKLVRGSGGWRIRELVEEGYWKHNLPTGFKF
jgi:hypothetical protein